MQQNSQDTKVVINQEVFLDLISNFNISLIQSDKFNELFIKIELK